VAVCLLVVLLVIRLRAGKNAPKKRREREEKYRTEYVCPVPTCKKHFGMTPYKELLEQHKCPYCRNKFVE